MSAFELWNMNSGNLLGTFTTEEAALSAVREAVTRHGLAYVDALALGHENSRGRSRIVAQGTALLHRVGWHGPEHVGDNTVPPSDRPRTRSA